MREKSWGRRQFIKAVAAAAFLGEGLTARRARAARRDLPNIIWILTDDLRADALGCYGSAWAKTPNIDALAQRGVVFQNAHVQSTVCMPSRGSMMTSRYCHNIGVLENTTRMTRDIPVLTTLLAREGYQTVNIGKLHRSWKGEDFQLKLPAPAPRVATPFKILEGDPQKLRVLNLPTPLNVIIGGTYPLPASKTRTAAMVDAAIRYFREKLRRPFLLRVSFTFPHTPVLAPKPFDELYDPQEIPFTRTPEKYLDTKPVYEREVLRPFEGCQGLTEEQIRFARASYYGLVAHGDHEIGRLLDEADSRKLLDNTIVVLTSDHGVQMGENGLFMKRNFYLPTLTVPLIFSWPGVLPEGRKLSQLVELVDLLPTLLDCAGIPVPPECHGRSLLGAMRGEEGGRRSAVFAEIDHEVSQWGKYLAARGARRVNIRTARWRMSYFISRSGRKLTTPEEKDGELYDLQNDPGELNNLYHNPRFRSVVEELEGQVERWDRQFA